jgi:pyruvate formate lyase activating enzyme
MPKEQPKEIETLSESLAARTRDGWLYNKLDNDWVHCYACGHNCKIPPGRFGVCRVRFNEGGQLRVPWGYVGGVQLDPVEKKPFFHAFPGALAMSFGMLGCDFHCSYCFPGETQVVTDRGPMPLSEVFDSAEQFDWTGDAEIGYPADLHAVAASGTLRKVRAVFKHRYEGELVSIRPYYLPELRCTPDHRIYATNDITQHPEKIEAKRLTSEHYLAIPRHHKESSISPKIDVFEQLSEHQVTYRVPWSLSVEDREFIAAATLRGDTSREIGEVLGKDASYIRHVRSKMNRGTLKEKRSNGSIIEDGFLRFPNEHRPGIPSVIALDTDMAELLGYYCAEGAVVRNKNRPNSYTLTFSFSHTEPELVETVIQLLYRYFGIEASRVERETTLAVAVGKASAGLLFQSLAGGRSDEKRVPQIIFDAPKPIAQAFLDAYVEGDGHRYENGKISITTVSKELAYGVAWLALKLGYLPSIYDAAVKKRGKIQGREIKRSPHQYTVVWYTENTVERKFVETEDYYLVPLRDVTATPYDGDVYNMEVEEEHNYLAGFFLVANCQNWITSQALRDKNAVAPPKDITPENFVSLARQYNAQIVTSTYNEPLITSEWGIDIFKEARKHGLVTSYVSNGNGTPEVLDALQPWVDLYKVDLKGFDDKNYRKLGGVLKNILDTIQMLHERHFWVEIVTLIVPGFNDSEAELKDIADFLVSVSPDIPWHVTAFHKDYKMTDPDNTSVSTLIRATEIGYDAGLRYVYAGNLPGHVGRYENTYCPNCAQLLIERSGFRVLANRIENGGCPKCRTKIAGVWSQRELEAMRGLKAQSKIVE